jgi:hypothetical protein
MLSTKEKQAFEKIADALKSKITPEIADSIIGYLEKQGIDKKTKPFFVDCLEELGTKGSNWHIDSKKVVNILDNLPDVWKNLITDDLVLLRVPQSDWHKYRDSKWVKENGMIEASFDNLVEALYEIIASIPTPDKPPSNIAALIRECEAKGRKDLGEKIQAQWEKVLEKYPATRLNWAAASTIGGNSIKKNVFGGELFVDWLAKQLKASPEAKEELKKEIPEIPVVAVPKGTPAIAIPKKGETPEDWKEAAAETAKMLVHAEKAFKSVEEFFAYLEKEIGDLKRKVEEYGPGGKKHLLKSGEPHSMSKRVPRWEAQLGAYEAKLKDVKAGITKAEKKFEEAAESYHVAPITTVEFENKAQDSLASVLEFILDIEDLEKQKVLLEKFKNSMERMEKDPKIAAEVQSSVVIAEGVGNFLELLWEKVSSFWDKAVSWAKGLVGAVDNFYEVAHMSGEPTEVSAAKAVASKNDLRQYFDKLTEVARKNKPAIVSEIDSYGVDMPIAVIQEFYYQDYAGLKEIEPGVQDWPDQEIFGDFDYWIVKQGNEFYLVDTQGYDYARYAARAVNVLKKSCQGIFSDEKAVKSTAAGKQFPVNDLCDLVDSREFVDRHPESDRSNMPNHPNWPVAEKVLAETFKELGQWTYYFDGSGGVFYAKTSKEELEDILNSEDYDGSNLLEVETAIPADSATNKMHFYGPGEDYPYQTLSLEEVNEEGGTEFKNWDEYFEADES